MPVVKGKAHGCSIAQRFSAQRAPYERRPRTPRIFDRCHLFSPWGRVFISCVCVCVREMGLLPWPYHANPFSRICSRLVSVPKCSQTVAGMFLIQSCRLFLLLFLVSIILEYFLNTPSIAVTSSQLVSSSNITAQQTQEDPDRNQPLWCTIYTPTNWKPLFYITLQLSQDTALL